MAKNSILKKPKKSKRPSTKEFVPFTSEILKDTKVVVDTLIECIKERDAESFRQVLYSHLRTTNKLQFAIETGIGRQTLYDLLDPKKKFNPKFDTLLAIFDALAA